ncbi:hypothetical protein LCI18_012655 [Fusarium solani-melongenae]|uniref:Uncharacterized protein n=1 Tax=Fusarium solani subsp. cucurbitae TaxID=2747967 RepID=A0ACD3ZKF8_FUSSC|nr:hypothetical protein LCI18_012655 [Fusarium solani-melongenae]
MGAEPAFQEPEVLLPVYEAEIRREFAVKIESEIRANPRTANFKLNAVQVATILPEHPEERKCSQRDGNVCVLIGTSRPWVGHIVPYAWNDTLANIQKTEKVSQHIQAFFGSSDKVWNMLCLNITDYGMWRSAKLGFKGLGIRPTSQGESVVILQFHWMPRPDMDPTKGMSLQGQNNDFDKMVECAKSLHSDGDSNLIHELPQLSIPSGRLIHVPMPNSEAVHFKAMIDLQWAMVVVAAFCGTADAPDHE